MANIHEKCAVFGVYNGKEAARLAFFGLYGLQHRGQEGSGIAAANGRDIKIHKGSGLVAHVYDENILQSFNGAHIAIGHNRYSTSGGSGVEHTQPVSMRPDLVLAHNGNLPLTHLMEDYLLSHDVKIDNLNDSELMYETIYHQMSSRRLSLSDAVEASFPLFTGAFSLLVMNKDELVAVRDGYGIRPFSFGEYEGGQCVFSSETCALDTVRARNVRDVLPGELISVSARGVETRRLVEGSNNLDIFEMVYFARPDSYLYGQRVNEIRRRFGERLANTRHIDADVVVPVPDSAISAGEGYSETSGIRLRQALIKNRYVHRTFITPGEHLRSSMADMKYNILQEVVKDKRVVLVDDSIVRLNTAPRLVRRLRENGAKEVHVMISSSQIRYPDFYGIDLPKQSALASFSMSDEEIREKINADSLTFLPYDEMIAATGVSRDQLYTGCFSGEYPIDLGERVNEFKKII